MARVLLVNAPGNETGKMPSKLGRWIPGEQLGLAYLAAVLRSNNHAVEIFEACMLGLTAEEVVETILSRGEALDLVGISIADGKQFGAAGCLELLDKLPPHIHLTIGGPTATLSAEEFLRRFPRLDSVVCGEGEAPLNALCDCLDQSRDWTAVGGLAYLSTDSGLGREVYRANQSMRLDPNALPFPVRDHIDLCQEQGFVVSIETSRGCKGGCTFCAARLAYGAPGSGWRARSAEHVLDELDNLARTYGVKRVSFEDEDFLGWGNKAGFDRARDIAHGILSRKLDIEFSFLTRVDNIDRELLMLLKQAGLRFIFLGVETESQNSLDRFGKHTSVAQNDQAIRTLRELDIDHEILFIMYEPDSTLDDVKANLRILKLVDRLNVNLLDALRIYHGTPMHQQMFEDGRLTGDFLSYKYLFSDPRVGVFERHATNGLNGFYAILRHMDAVRWSIGEDNDLSRAMVSISKRLNQAAANWLDQLMVAIENRQDPAPLQDTAEHIAIEIASVLQNLVTNWTVIPNSTSSIPDTELCR